jgi:hypothetical protein
LVSASRIFPAFITQKLTQSVNDQA